MAVEREAPSPRGGVLVGLSMLSIGVGCFLLGTAEGATARLVRGNVPINAGAGSPLDVNAHNSPTLARDPVRPDHLAAVDRVDVPRPSCSLHLSYDAGATWGDIPIPIPAGEEEPPRCFAPDAAFGADGTLHVSFLTLKDEANTPNALWITSSLPVDGGRRLATPTRVAGPLAFQPRLTADPAVAGRLYLTWLQAAGVNGFGFPDADNPVVMSRSDDGGATWGQAVRVSPSSRRRVLAPSLAVGPDKHLLVLYIDLGDDAFDYQGGHRGQGGLPYPGTWSLVLARSTDGGATWAESLVERRVIPTERIVALTPPSPSLVVDPERRRVYVGFHEGHLGGADVWVWASANGGVSFGRPRRVNDTPRRDGTSQYLAVLAVAPKGRLDVAYYDRRSDPSDVFNEVSLQSSSDGGRTFTRRLRLSDRHFDSRVGFGAERKLPALGSRLGIVSTDAGAFAAWADTRAGTEASGKQDVAFVAVALGDASPLGAPLRYGGMGAGALAAVVLARRVLETRQVVGQSEPPQSPQPSTSGRRR